MLTRQAWGKVARSLGLSARELQIVRGVFDDKTEFAIAEDLGISPHTIHTHFSRLHRKLGVATRTGLVLRITSQCLALVTARQNQMRFSLSPALSPD